MLRRIISLCCLLLALPATATRIDVRYVDDDGHGYQDNTPVPPTAGNPGTTNGEQAQVAFEYVSSLVERTVWIPDEVPLQIEAWHLPSGKPSHGVLPERAEQTIQAGIYMAMSHRSQASLLDSPIPRLW